MSVVSVPLILGTTQVGPFNLDRRPVPAGVAAVYARPDGTLVNFRNRTPTLAESWRYRLRYDVDVSDHEHEIQRSVPSADDRFQFQARMRIGFRVADPVEVVRRAIADGLALVAVRLVEIMRPMCRRFGLADVDEAERAVNDWFPGLGLLVDGIMIRRFSVHISLDADASRYLAERPATDADRREPTAVEPLREPGLAARLAPEGVDREALKQLLERLQSGQLPGAFGSPPPDERGGPLPEGVTGGSCDPTDDSIDDLLDDIGGVRQEDAEDFVRGYVDPPAERQPGPAAAEPDRYLVGELPSRVRAGAESSLIVSITTRSPEPGPAAAAMPGLVLGPTGTDVTIVIQPDAGLLAIGDLQQTVAVPPRGDGAPVRFAFRARTVGLSRIRVTAWFGGTFLAELRLEVSVESDVPAPDSQRHSAPMSQLRADAGEVTLQVHFDGARYSFQLLSQRYLFGPVIATSLSEQPGQAVERTVAMLRKMAAAAAGYPPALAARWVRETGTGLWQDLVPRSIQDQFWQLRDSITSFTIACADDAVPWELLYPLSPTDDAGFLVEQFPVVRRVFDQGRARQVPLGDARYVVPPGSPDNAQQEVAAIRRVLGQPGDATIGDLSDLLDLLDAGTAGLLHFACHNTFSLAAGGSSITMAGGAFVPQLLNSAVARRRLAARSPLVFVNACRSAGVAVEYTRMMGWAGQFMAAGAGAFIGTLWPVSSTGASRYAEAFYAALAAGQDLGRASLAARVATRNDADPTWLAYTTYGDPAAVAAR
jgi:ubiquitin-like protein Pup